MSATAATPLATRLRAAVLVIAATGAALAASAGAARAQLVYSNPAAITIADARQAAPSFITVSGASGAPVGITLNGFSHSFLQDLEIVLVGPTNKALWLMRHAGGSYDAFNADVTFAFGHPVFLNGNINGTVTYGPDATPYAAFNGSLPGGNDFATTFAALAGADPNGRWGLYISDTVGGDAGAVARGWSLTFADPNAPPPVTAAPEPSTYTLLGAGLLALGGAVRRRRAATTA